MTKPMTCDQFADQLADYLDGDVDAATRVAMETHASSCAECGALLADLRKIQIDATNLPELEPTRDLWSGIAARIETPVVELKNGGTVERWSGGTQQRPKSTSRVWIGIAAAGLVAVTATITHEMTKRSMTTSTPVLVAQNKTAQPKPDTTTRSAQTTQVASVDSVPANHQTAVSPSSVPSASTRLASSKPSVQQTYDIEINRLRAVLNRRRPQLDSATVAVVEHNLQVIDDAIKQCRSALQKDPASRFLIESLNDALDTKVQLLRTAASLPSTT